MSVESGNDEFFVGWLQTPSSYVRFLKPIVITLVLIAICSAGVFAFFQRASGSGQWDDDKVVTLRGIAFTRPYAMLRVAGDRPGDSPRTYLLVEEGKFGALPRVSMLEQDYAEGIPVEVKGTILHRDDRWMFELEEGEAAMRVLPEDRKSVV